MGLDSLNEVPARLLSDITALRSLELSELIFDQLAVATATAMVLIGLCLASVLLRSVSRRGRPARLALPALVALPPRRSASFLRHGAWFLFAAGLPLFMVALAAPFRAFTHEQVSYPGSRIAILIDASSSMTAPFDTWQLTKPGAPNHLFVALVGAAEKFIDQRRNGRYRDLVALIEFGNAAYVMTPFTNDYANVLLSVSMIGEWEEFERFPDMGTTIGSGVRQAVNLFTSFDYLNAAGNAMVILSDGQDTGVGADGKTARDMMTAAAEAGIVVFFVRCGLNRRLGDVAADAVWKPLVEATGGRFYAAAHEQDLLDAIDDIDRRVVGTVDVKQYAVRQPQFVPFALAACALWVLALAAKLTLPYFTTFP